MACLGKRRNCRLGAEILGRTVEVRWGGVRDLATKHSEFWNWRQSLGRSCEGVVSVAPLWA